MSANWYGLVSEEPTYVFEYDAENNGRTSVKISNFPKKMQEFVLKEAICAR